MRNRHVYIFSFDGTLTDIPHEKTVLSEFFERAVDTDILDDMVPDPDKFPLYVTMQVQKLDRRVLKDRAMEIENKIVEIITAQSTTNAMDLASKPYLLSAGAVEYLQLLLSNPNNFVTIVSNNMEEYIEGVLRFNQFTPEQLNKLVIADHRKHKGDKSSILVDIYDELHDRGGIADVTIYENNSADMKAMREMTAECCSPDTKIFAVERKPKNFLYAAYAAEYLVKENIPDIVETEPEVTRKRSGAFSEQNKKRPAGTFFQNESDQNKQFKKGFTKHMQTIITDLKNITTSSLAKEANLPELINNTIKELQSYTLIDTSKMNHFFETIINRQHDMIDLIELYPSVTDDVKRILTITNQLLDYAARGANHYIGLREELYQKVNIDLKQQFRNKPDIEKRIEQINNILYDRSITSNETFEKTTNNLLRLCGSYDSDKQNETSPFVKTLRESQERLLQNKSSLRPR